MIWPADNAERRICPPEMQERLTLAGGVNPYDEPIFKLAWGQTQKFRAGGCWAVEGEASFVGYRDLLLGSNTPCWMLLMWNPPEVYGTPGIFYFHNWDEATGLQTLGEYPHKGRYEVVSMLMHREIVNGQLMLEAMPLSAAVLEAAIHIIREAKDISLEKRKAAFDALRASEEKEREGQIEDALRAAAVPFGGNPVSFSRQGCRTALIDKKVREMERHWTQAIDKVRSLGKGISQLPN